MIYHSARRYLEGLKANLRIYCGSFIVPIHSKYAGYTLDECGNMGFMMWILREKSKDEKVRFLSFFAVDACREIVLLIFDRLVSFILSSRSSLGEREVRGTCCWEDISTILKSHQSLSRT